MYPGYSFLTELCLGIRFFPLQGFLAELILDHSYQRVRVVVIQPHKSEYRGLSGPLWYNLSVSYGTLLHYD